MLPTVGVKLIGSKRELIPFILNATDELVREQKCKKSIIDVCTGTTRVSQALRHHNYKIVSSDLSWASESYAHLFLITTQSELDTLNTLIMELNSIRGKSGWITKNYCDAPSIDGGNRVKMW